ncbi:DUF1624 domain-containing protein [Sphingopyxis sp. JAI128]|uniref:DUF1624 domain-containing protein n=1 Tax=Sphingopyxis sp. JAI128 TaxID=2723066 RepID=UPI001613E3A4|nr:heparan-alpha-glucosaminide N-acetyltransferase domain-containing protein [Sphingopyxis sp. JAI128]MBB6426988.1 putative membrane protein [Sphingopyxis sp. JAI128]
MPADPAPPGERPGGAGRVASIDLLRGLVMVVMALDHVRDFTSRSAMQGSPTDLATTTAAVFFTRWITHICAPAFALAAGLAAWLWWQRHGDRRALSRFLVTRGLWLMALEIGVMQFAYYFAWPVTAPVLLLVLWSLGLSMVALAGLAWLPRPAILVVALAAILCHPLLDPLQASSFGAAAGIWNILHQVGAFPVGSAVVATPYPLIPWAGVMALGFALAPVFHLPQGIRLRTLLALGIAALTIFVLLRVGNAYGDPVPWQADPDPLRTVMSFLNVSKYPASPAFLAMTLGFAFLLLGLFEGGHARVRPGSILLTLGRVPLVFYILHFFAAHLFATLLWFAIYGPPAASFSFLPYPSFGGPRGAFPADFGLPLWGSYAVWLAVLAAVYPLCSRFSRFRAERQYWWLRYL